MAHIESRRFFKANCRIFGAILYANAPTVVLKIVEAFAELIDQRNQAEGFVKLMLRCVDDSDDHLHIADIFDILFSELKHYLFGHQYIYCGFEVHEEKRWIEFHESCLLIFE
jgi:hypothetical protein